MKHVKLYVVLSVALFFLISCSNEKYDIRHFGAVGDGTTLSTEAINNAILQCSANGGGKVVIPEGTFLTATIHLKDNVILHLKKGAVLSGTDDLSLYDLPVSNPSMGRAWNRGLIMGENIHHAGIEGEGETSKILGNHVFDQKGEEGMRGPHAIAIFESEDISFRNFRVHQASNYAFLMRRINTLSYDGVIIDEGWDGINAHRCPNLSIRNCVMHTGDDAIALAYSNHTIVENCYLNSACNGLRSMESINDLTFRNCTFEGPAKYQHKTDGASQMMHGLFLQHSFGGVWSNEDRCSVDSVTISECKFKNVQSPIYTDYFKNDSLGKISITNCESLGVYAFALSIKNWYGAKFSKVSLENCYFSYKGHGDAAIVDTTSDILTWPTYPCWGAYFRNIDTLVLRNNKLELESSDIRPAAAYSSVNTIIGEKL